MVDTQLANKKHKLSTKILFIISIAFILLVATVLCINIIMVKSSENQIISVNDAIGSEPDCIIVLGAMVHSDGTPSLILKERLDTAIELYNAGVSDKILMSGDNGQKEYNEVIPMRQYALDMGVPEEDIYLDYAGFSTYESMYRLRDIFQVEKAVIVTQTYHLYRALYIGNSLGIDVTGVEAADRQSGRNWRNIREVLARVKSFGLLLIDAEPTYLGDPISLNEPQQIIE